MDQTNRQSEGGWHEAAPRMTPVGAFMIDRRQGARLAALPREMGRSGLTVSVCFLGKMRSRKFGVKPTRRLQRRASGNPSPGMFNTIGRSTSHSFRVSDRANITEIAAPTTVRRS